MRCSGGRASLRRPGPCCRVKPSRTYSTEHARGTGNPRFFSSPCMFFPYAPGVFSARRRDRLPGMGWTPRGGGGRWCADVRRYESVAALPGPGPARGQSRSVSEVSSVVGLDGSRQGKRTSGEVVFPHRQDTPHMQPSIRSMPHWDGGPFLHVLLTVYFFHPFLPVLMWF
jgi:hypothetical protein